MPRLPTETRNAANGYDSTNDPTLLPANRAALLRNFVLGRAGILRATLAHTLKAQFPAGVDGMFHYQGNESDEDRLLVVSGGVLYATTLSPVNFLAIGSGFQTGKQVRAAAFDDELFFVQEGGITPLRFNGESLFRLGIAAPSAPVAVGATPANSAVSVKVGTISYRTRYFDEKARESEPSSSVSVAFAATGYDGHVTVFPSWQDIDPQVSGVYIEATTTGGSVYYRIATLLRSANQVFYEDNNLDSIVSSSTVSAGLGRRSVPNKASCIAAHKNFLWMNDTESPRQLQISALNAPTYFSTVTEVAASDGGRMTIPGARGGNPILQLSPFGSLLSVILQQGIIQIFGETLASFRPRELHVRGTVAPGSAVRVDNGVWFLLDASVYNMDYEGQFVANRVSQEIDADLRRHTSAERRNAFAVYSGSRYILHVGGTLYCYDFTAPGWGQIRLDTSVTTAAATAGLQALATQLQSQSGGGSGGSSPQFGMAPVVPVDPGV